MKRILLTLAAAVLATSCAYGVSEKYFFFPKPATKIVIDPAQMKIVDEHLITAPSVATNADFTPIARPRLPATLLKDIHTFSGIRIALAHVKAANAQPGEPLIVYCGGNASDMINRGVYYTNKVLPWGELLMWDYPGYGHSTANPYARAFDQVFTEMVPWIDEQARGRPLVLWGHSIGGLICSRIAQTSREVDAIVLETTALSPQRMAKDKTWALPMIDAQVQGDWRTFDILEMLDGFSGPVMVIGAGKDSTLPVNLAREVNHALKQKHAVTYVEYAEMGHLNAALNSDFARDGAAFFAKVSDTRR